jgi:hypothetical protein
MKSMGNNINSTTLSSSTDLSNNNQSSICNSIPDLESRSLPSKLNLDKINDNYRKLQEEQEKKDILYKNIAYYV